MIKVTGNKTPQGYRLHQPTFPYTSCHYVGYSLTELKKYYRKQYGLEGKHIEWIILGV